MKQAILIGLVLVLGITAGALISPLFAQQQNSFARTGCYVGEGSGAACSGKWIYFAGNVSGVDSGAWVVRMDSDTGQIWYKNGKKLVLLSTPD